MSVARLTLGTAQLGARYGIANRRGRPSDTEVEAILSSAFEHGVRSLDTAPDYGDAESRIGEHLRRHGRPAGLALCTKLPRLPAQADAAGLERIVASALDASRRRLETETIDVYLIHAAGDLHRHGAALVDALTRLRDAGRIRRAGVSVYDPAELDGAFDGSALTAVQYPFNLFDRRMRRGGRAARLARAGVDAYARSPLLQGLLGIDADDLPASMSVARPYLARLTDLCRGHGRPADVALRYAAERSAAGHIVLGVESRAQLDDALDALDAALPAALADEIEREFADLPPELIDPRRWSAS